MVGMIASPVLKYENVGNGESNDEISTTDNSKLNANRVLWEKHSNGFATKMLKKMGYNGKGLSKNENGIIEPIQVNAPNLTYMARHQAKRNPIYIASDSMLNEIDGERLSRTHDAKVKSDGGCTLEKMFTHLPDIIESKPDSLIYHIGTNDCGDKTTDEVLNQIHSLIGLASRLLPTTKVVLSTTINRGDKQKANVII